MSGLPERLELESMDIAHDRVTAIRSIVPEAFTELGIDWDALRRTLGEWVEPGRNALV